VNCILNLRRPAFGFCAFVALASSALGQPADAAWSIARVPGAWETNGPAAASAYDGIAWYRAWLKPHDSFFTPHERNLFAESVTLNIRSLADAHEVFVNGTRVGAGGSFPPQFTSGRDGNHRHKIPPGLLKKGEWNAIAVRVYNASGPGGFLTEAPFVMDYFNECVLAGDWEWRAGDDPAWASGVATNEKPARAAFDQYHESNRVLGEAAQFVHGPKLSPEQSATNFTTASDLVIEQLLHEPLVAQPTHLSYDARGRLWVAQYRQYPYPAGVKMLSRDKYYRAHYDKVPPAPPNHDRGRDVISIHEDTDGDGRFDQHKVFVDGLNMANAVLPGRNGVWVMHTPYLLFYPDRDGDDVPDGAPTVHLAGFGLEDTHSVANGLVWGPDSWIYGGQGSTTSSRVVRPGLDATDAPGVYFEGCMIWRYHPQTRVYEIFAEGSGNVFGLELDGEGRLFSGHNGAETRGWHYQQGGYYMKQGVDPGKFGPPRNPYSFGELPWMKLAAPIQRFTHGVAVVEGTALPASRQGQMFWVDPIHSLLIATERQTRGATFGTRDLDQVVKSADEGFRPVFIVNAPDGSLHVADFYEHYIAHGQHYQSQIDPTTGRIYRLRGQGSALEKDVNLAGKSTDELLALLSHPNKWHRQTAARVLGWRGAPEVQDKLRSLLASGSAPVAALWALHQAGGLDESTALATLKHPSPPIREWTVRLLGDRKELSPNLAEAMTAQARAETDVRVRAQMASSARRLPVAPALSLVTVLASHAADAGDPFVPLLCWWVLESHLAKDRDAVLSLFRSHELWNRPLVQEHLLPRLMRRFAVEGRRQDLLVCASLLRAAPSTNHTAQLMKGFEEAYRGRAMSGLPDELLTALAATGHAPLVLRVRQGDAAAVDDALAQIQNPKAQLEDRLLCIRTLGEVRATKAVKPLLSLALGDQLVPLRKAAFAALTAFDDPSLAADTLSALTKLPAEIRPAALAFLTSRATSSVSLLEAIQARRVDPTLIPPDVADRLRQAKDRAVAELAAKVLPRAAATTSTAWQKRIAEVETILKRAPGNPYAGEAHFNARCASCHKLFFKGGNVGPDLTAYQRDNLGTLLISILNPNAEIREGYTYVEIETSDGRNLGGFLTDRDARVTVLRGLDGQDMTLRAAEIRSLEPTGRSLMPEGLLDDLNDEQLRDFFAYLRQSQPFTR
jgi:putative membrane-bound dehydrogenase-like protein